MQLKPPPLLRSVIYGALFGFVVAGLLWFEQTTGAFYKPFPVGIILLIISSLSIYVQVLVYPIFRGLLAANGNVPLYNFIQTISIILFWSLLFGLTHLVVSRFTPKVRWFHFLFLIGGVAAIGIIAFFYLMPAT